MSRFHRLDMDKFQTFLTHCFCILSQPQINRCRLTEDTVAFVESVTRQLLH